MAAGTGVRGDEGVGARPRVRALGLAEAALACLSGAGAALDDDAIHDLRVACKHLRAYWQLLRPLALDRQGSPLGARYVAARDHALRDAMRTLGTARDLHVFADTLESLRRSGATRRGSRSTEADAVVADGKGSAALDLIAREVADEARGLQTAAPDRDGLVQLFEAQRSSIEALPTDLRRRTLRAGLLRAYERARAAGRGAVLQHDVERWHLCRRWVKYERCQWAFVDPGGDPGFGVFARGSAQSEAPVHDAPTGDRGEQGVPVRRLERLKMLADLLGRQQDLEALRAFVEAHATRRTRGAHEEVQRLIDRRVRALRRPIARRFTRLYGRDARRHERRLRAWLSRL